MRRSLATWSITAASTRSRPALTGRNLAGFTYLGTVGAAISYALWFRSVGRLGTAASFLLLLSPVMAVFLGFAVLGQSLTAIQLAGVALVLGSVALGQYLAQPTARNAQKRPGAVSAGRMVS